MGPFLKVLLTFSLLASSRVASSHHDFPTVTPHTLAVKKASPTVAVAPLDPNESIHHTLETVTSLLGIIGGSVSSLTVGLTGVSIVDCALTFKGVDVSTLSCEDFLDQLSTCDSLQNVRPLLKSSKKKYRKAKGQTRKSRRPCASDP